MADLSLRSQTNRHYRRNPIKIHSSRDHFRISDLPIFLFFNLPLSLIFIYAPFLRVPSPLYLQKFDYLNTLLHALDAIIQRWDVVVIIILILWLVYRVL